MAKKKWVKVIEEYEQFSNVDFVHPFFGKMNKEQIGYLAYKQQWEKRSTLKKTHPYIMDEFETITNYVKRHIDLTDEEGEYFVSLLRISKVRKKQLIVQPEFTCKYRSYIFSGAMRAYLVDRNVNEHTIAFAIEDWWISDYNSYIFQQPATLFVEALEETTLIQLDYNAEQLLKQEIPKFEKFFRIITERSFAFLQKRLLSNLSLSAEERYEEFMSKYSKVALRLPQYTLASYLGMSTEYLSKLRNNRVSKKS